jgi:hypothetical protein
MDTSFTLELPEADGSRKEIITKSSFLLIGANGSGKTRLGTWIEMESTQKDKVHRISAQKSLAMPDNTTPTSIKKAQSNLLYGNADIPEGQGVNYKTGHKWSNKPAITLLNDYQKLMVYLFSDHTEEGAKYLAASKLTNDKVNTPTTKLDLVKQVWEKVLPHRELVLGGLSIQTKVKGSDGRLYSSSEMSDGERVIFYLIGQCLAAKENGIIVIDEPEIHLHKSVQAPLWREIQKLRTDCLFVYLTHDVDFAVSLQESQKIWLKAYDGQNWEWDLVESVDGLPEELLVEILGSRKPIVFIEGENGSFDTSLYRSLLNDFLVIPRGSCSQVIESTKALKSSPQLHHLNVYGIIDRDRRVDAEIASLEAKGVFTLQVAEVENLFCTKELLAIVSKRLSRNEEDDFNAVVKFVINRLNSELENQISLRTVGEIKFRLNMFDDKAKGAENLNTALTALTENIDVSGIYQENKVLFEGIIETSDYNKLLKTYNRKSLSSQIGVYLGLKGGELPEFVVRIAKTDAVNELRNTLKPYFGNFANLMA